MIRRFLRLELIAGLGIALALPALSYAGQSSAAPSGNAELVATQIALAAELHDHAGRTQATLTVTVTGEDRSVATGSVSISDNGRPLAGAALNAQGQATLVLALPAGPHTLSANYSGDRIHSASTSRLSPMQAQATTTPDFQISVAPTALTISPGNSGDAVASVTPENSSALSAPMFITLSCSGLPDQASCTFTPANVEILPNATAPITSSMVILTQQASSIALPGITGPDAHSVALAVLLPGALGLGCLAWSARRRPWLQRLWLLGFPCNARYRYFNHGPPVDPATPAGTYTINVTAQSSNGVSATTHTTTLALTVQ
ncbi:MAG: Ig-like domain-containing protein [Terracidiphilus sp.]